MSKVKFVLNPTGVKALLQGDAMQSVLQSHAQGVQQRAGEGFAYDVYVGKTRANASVYADSFEARRKNLKENTLLKALK